jgi:homoserine kinase
VRVSVRVPATSANLGPGFDCFGLALDLCNEVTVDTEAEPGVTWEGEGADELPTDGTDTVSRMVAALLANGELPQFSLHGVNRIPLERGLGSSSAAAVAGVAIAIELLRDEGSDGSLDEPFFIFSYAGEFEGHPDNAAACTYGGFTVVSGAIAHRLEPHPSLLPVVLIPEDRVSTSRARAVLPSTVPREDAVFNIERAALTVIALTQDPDLLIQALHDRLHEEARASLMPRSADLLAHLRRRQFPACLSGAGPSLLAFEREGHAVRDLPDGWRAIRPGVRAKGVEVVVED